MGKIKMKTRKYFDVQYGEPKMPEDVRNYFFKHAYDTVNANDVWVRHLVGLSIEHSSDGKPDMLDQWLMDTFEVEDGEEIFLAHWW